MGACLLALDLVRASLPYQSHLILFMSTHHTGFMCCEKGIKCMFSRQNRNIISVCSSILEVFILGKWQKMAELVEAFLCIWVTSFFCYIFCIKYYSQIYIYQHRYTLHLTVNPMWTDWNNVANHKNCKHKFIIHVRIFDFLGYLGVCATQRKRPFTFHSLKKFSGKDYSIWIYGFCTRGIY